MKRLLTVIAICTLISCGNKKQNAVEEGWAVFEGENYSIAYPEQWELNPSKQFGAEFMFFSPLSSEADKFRENVTLVVQELLDQDMNLDEFTELSIEQVKSFVTNANIIESKRIEEKGKIAHQSITYTGKQGVFELELKQHFWILNNTAYVLTFTMQKEDKNEHKEVGKKIMDSFFLQ